METRRARARRDTLAEIKGLARQQMQTEGTAAISLRGIAREMGVTVTALYRYYANRDDLITALIADAFNALADALEIAAHAHDQSDYIEQARQIFIAYRRWALEHPTDFQLIYGNPIPGYVAPREVTVPAVVRGFAVMLRALVSAVHAGQAQVVLEHPIPASVSESLRAAIEADHYPVTVEQFYFGIAMWTRLHGIIMLELFHHLQPVVSDVEAYYLHEVNTALAAITSHN